MRGAKRTANRTELVALDASGAFLNQFGT